MPTATGATPRMVRYGRRALRRAGPLITTATGPGSDRGAGLGWMTSRGASPRFTMDAGLMQTAAGDGTLAWLRRAPTTRPRWSRSLAAEVSALASRPEVAAEGRGSSEQRADE